MKQWLQCQRERLGHFRLFLVAFILLRLPTRHNPRLKEIATVFFILLGILQIGLAMRYTVSLVAEQHPGKEAIRQMRDGRVSRGGGVTTQVRHSRESGNPDVIPAKAGIQTNKSAGLDSRFRWNDGKGEMAAPPSQPAPEQAPQETGFTWKGSRQEEPKPWEEPKTAAWMQPAAASIHGAVIPAKAGIQAPPVAAAAKAGLDSGFRGNDGNKNGDGLNGYKEPLKKPLMVSLSNHEPREAGQEERDRPELPRQKKNDLRKAMQLGSNEIATGWYWPANYNQILLSILGLIGFGMGAGRLLSKGNAPSILRFGNCLILLGLFAWALLYFIETATYSASVQAAGMLLILAAAILLVRGANTSYVDPQVAGRSWRGW